MFANRLTKLVRDLRSPNNSILTSCFMFRPNTKTKHMRRTANNIFFFHRKVSFLLKPNLRLSADRRSQGEKKPRIVPVHSNVERAEPRPLLDKPRIAPSQHIYYHVLVKIK